MRAELVDVPQPVFARYADIENLGTFRIRDSRAAEVWIKMAGGDSLSLMSGMTLETEILESKPLILVEQVAPLQFRDVNR